MNTQFNEPLFLQQHIKKTLAFYHPHCLDQQSSNSGFYHFFKDDGTIYNKSSRHLVSSCRFIFNYAMAYMEFAQNDYQTYIQHGLDHLNNVHKRENGGYIWELEQDDQGNITITDDTNHCYGLAFVLLANAVALKAGFTSCKTSIEQTWELLERLYYQPEYRAYLDEYNADFTESSSYRGQNANMHMCEALLMCYEATQDQRYLTRAEQLAITFTQHHASKHQGLIWEHYDQFWQVDLSYNQDNPKHLFRPWGFQPGHQTEWAKLLLILYRHKSQPWLIERSKSLFDQAMATAWDETNGGIYYGFAPDQRICDSDKYFWVQAESFAAAALLAQVTNEEKYWQWYTKIWQYSWDNMIDHQYGAWYRILDSENKKYSDEKSPAGKTDYHTMGACYEVLRSINLRTQS